jgi:enoyl-[acyl-carrier protein] reductase I
MGFLTGKKIVDHRRAVEPFDRLRRRPACRDQGAELAFSYVGERFKDRDHRIRGRVRLQPVFDCDVGDDAQIENLFKDLSATWPKFDGFVHSIGFAPREPSPATSWTACRAKASGRPGHQRLQLSGDGQGRAALPERQGGAADAVVPGRGQDRARTTTPWAWPRPRLEASVRYLAGSLGPKGIRVNGVSAGPIKTLAASGIKDFGKLLSIVAGGAPLRRNVTIEDVGNCRRAFLLSDLASGVTAENHLRGRRLSQVAIGVEDSRALRARDPARPARAPGRVAGRGSPPNSPRG